MLTMASVFGFRTFRKFRIISPLNTVSGFFFLCMDQTTFSGWTTVLTYSKPAASAAFTMVFHMAGSRCAKTRLIHRSYFSTLNIWEMPSPSVFLKCSAVCFASPFSIASAARSSAVVSNPSHASHKCTSGRGTRYAPRRADR